MFEKLKIFAVTRLILQIPRRLLLWFLCLATLLMLTDDANYDVVAQSCSNLKFPLTLGFSSGETEIISIDQDSLTGYLYIGGTSTATELRAAGSTKSVFTALFDGLQYLWIKVINDPAVDTFESMSAMGSSSPYLVLYATKSSSSYIPLIFIISKSDGSIVRVIKINTIGDVNPPSK